MLISGKTNFKIINIIKEKWNYMMIKIQFSKMHIYFRIVILNIYASSNRA